MNSTVSERMVGGSNESVVGVLTTVLPVGSGVWQDVGPAGEEAGGLTRTLHDGGHESGRRRRADAKVKSSTAAVGSASAAG